MILVIPLPEAHGMGNSIVLDPYDVYRLTALRGDTLEHLLVGRGLTEKRITALF